MVGRVPALAAILAATVVVAVVLLGGGPDYVVARASPTPAQLVKGNLVQAQNLATATPDLTRTFTVLNHFPNLLGYNEAGRQGPDVAGRDEGYLFWLAWLQHDGAALFSTSDANGPFRPVTLGGTCTVLREITGDNPPLNLLYQPALLNPRVCGNR